MASRGSARCATHSVIRCPSSMCHLAIRREARHCSAASREGNLPYPQRAIRTRDFLYIHNFAPDRWPMGDPCGLDDPHAEAPSFEELSSDTLVAYADLDAGPTKAWMVHHRAEEDVQELFQLGFGKRPKEELYDLRVASSTNPMPALCYPNKRVEAMLASAPHPKRCACNIITPRDTPSVKLTRR